MKVFFTNDDFIRTMMVLKYPQGFEKVGKKTDCFIVLWCGAIFTVPVYGRAPI